MNVKDLNPKIVWEIFDEITKVPRPSKHEEKMLEYLVAFAKKHNIEYKTDEIGNIAMFRPAAPGYENVPSVVLQGHMDMVCVKNDDVEFDFEKDPIQTVIDGDWLRTKGTTLGADNGMGVAAGLAALIDPDLICGPVQGLFTKDEETSMTGANNIGEGMINGKILLNLDSEVDGEICIGCAGGIGLTATFEYTPVAAPADLKYVDLRMEGFQGGHSGMEIGLGKACCNKLLARFLNNYSKENELQLATFEAGQKHNAISVSAHALVGVKDAETLAKEFKAFEAVIIEEYKYIEKGITCTAIEQQKPAFVIDSSTASRLIKAVSAVHHGVKNMSLQVEGLVETSSNMAMVTMCGNNKIEVLVSHRSSVDSRKWEAATQAEALFKLAGAKVEFSDDYPGWAPNAESHILKTALSVYENLYGVVPTFGAIHAGLECGLFLTKFPGMDMISFGPTLVDIHSPEERAYIPSVERFWNFTKGILVKIAEENK